jgi:tetratricopeptide (TPR) repeat protein
MRGVLEWHRGDYDASIALLQDAFEIADQVGRSEVAFESLFWLAASLRDRGDHADADQSLARALDLCERAGLVAQSVEATAARAVNLALWGKGGEAAFETAQEATGLAERLRYPVGVAAAVEARGAATGDAGLLREARAAWLELDRPVDAERCAGLLERA